MPVRAFDVGRYESITNSECTPSFLPYVDALKVGDYKSDIVQNHMKLCNTFVLGCIVVADAGVPGGYAAIKPSHPNH